MRHLHAVGVRGGKVVPGDPKLRTAIFCAARAAGNDMRRRERRKAFKIIFAKRILYLKRCVFFY
jgi:hypothetical protein